MFVFIGGNSRLFLPVVSKLAHGQPVIATYRSQIPPMAAVSPTAQNLIWRRLDLEDHSQVASFSHSLASPRGGLTVVFAAAHVYDSLIARMDMDRLKQTLQVNVVAPTQIVRSLLPKMITERAGNFVFISSVVVKDGSVGASAYGISKAATEGLSSGIASEYRRFGVRSNVLRLGYTGYGMNEDIRGFPDAGTKPVDISSLTESLCNALLRLSQNAGITGQVLEV